MNALLSCSDVLSLNVNMLNASTVHVLVSLLPEKSWSWDWDLKASKQWTWLDPRLSTHLRPLTNVLSTNLFSPARTANIPTSDRKLSLRTSFSRHWYLSTSLSSSTQPTVLGQHKPTENHLTLPPVKQRTYSPRVQHTWSWHLYRQRLNFIPYNAENVWERPKAMQTLNWIRWTETYHTDSTVSTWARVPALGWHLQTLCCMTGQRPTPTNNHDPHNNWIIYYIDLHTSKFWKCPRLNPMSCISFNGISSSDRTGKDAMASREDTSQLSPCIGHSKSPHKDRTVIPTERKSVFCCIHVDYIIK